MAQRILRPMEFGDILDETFDLYKKHFLLFAGIAGLVYLPVNLILYSIIYSLQPAAAVLIPTLMLPFYFLVMAAATWAVSQSYLGTTPTILQSYRTIAKRALAFIGTMLIATIVVYIGFIACFIPGLIFLFWYAFISEVFVVEGKSWTAARNRSKKLAEGEWGRIFVVGFLTILITAVASQLLQQTISLITGTNEVEAMMEGGFIGVLYGLAGGLSQALTTPLQVIAFVLLYYDIRVRKEGFDLELLAANLGQSQTADNADLPN